MLKVNLISELSYLEHVNATKGAQINMFLEQVRTLSILLNKRLIAIHNSREVVVEPHMSTKALLDQWYDQNQLNR